MEEPTGFEPYTVVVDGVRWRVIGHSHEWLPSPIVGYLPDETPIPLPKPKLVAWRP